MFASDTMSVRKFADYLLLFCPVFLVATTAWSIHKYREASTQPAGIECDFSACDLGQISNGQKYQCRFRLQNRSSVPFQITGVKYSCACLESDANVGEIIQPGDQIDIVVRVDSTGLAGSVKRMVFIYSQPHGDGESNKSKLDLIVLANVL
jgi:hypothetical protein